MNKKIILSAIFIVFATFFGGIFFAQTARAADFEIKADDTAVLRNQEFIFEYKDISPGFSAAAPINIVNNATSPASVKLIGIQPVDSPVAPKPAPANNLLPYVNISFARENVVIAQARGANLEVLIGTTVCVSSGQSETLMNNFSLPANVGNGAQSTSMWLKYTFEVAVGSCEIVAPPNTTNSQNSGKPVVNPPNTSETALPFLVMGGTFSVAFFVALIFCAIFIISILKRKKNDREARARH